MAAHKKGIKQRSLTQVFFCLLSMSMAITPSFAPAQAHDGATAIMFSKQAVLGLRLGAAEYFEKKEITGDQLACVNGIGHEELIPFWTAILARKLHVGEREAADRFYSSPLGQKIQKYADEQLYRASGIAPDETTVLTDTDLDEYEIFQATSAGRKLLHRKVLEDAFTRRKVYERLGAIFKRCNVFQETPE